ncbi:MAG: carbohydrate binding family 9 domain-containing protein [Gemmatimonadaceae bacterium]|nr:carbohydrate binding family 9 domain-containing protein [Gemmatimonadaceae bacterium]
MSRPSAGRSALAFVAPLLASAALAAQSMPAPPRTGSGGAVPAARTGQPHVVTMAPVIDGKLDEAAWKDAAPFDGFVQRESREGEPVTERTEVRILTDGEALYVGAWLFDRDAQGIVPGEKLRDVLLTNSDNFSFIIDTYLDRQNGFVFATTPAGVEYDGQVVREGEGGGVQQAGQARVTTGSLGGFNLNWDGSWTVATTVDGNGWYAEFRIPFSTLRYGGGREQTWGFNMARGIRRKNEESLWSFVPRQFSLYRLSRAGTLAGVTVPVRRVATVTPYALSSTTRSFATETQYRHPTEFGIDAKYGLTPSLTLDLTYNTDFAQVEVDEQRTNLTRFPLFFPEKRTFFLENAGVFSAGTPQAVDLFFTRRIGIDAVGNPVPILGGGRVTGRVAGLTVGLLQIFTDDASATQPGNSYSVARATKEVGRRSRVGVIGVQRMGLGDADGDHNRTFGIDGRLGLSDAVTFDAWGGKTLTPGRGHDDLAFSTLATYSTRDWNNSVRYLQTGRDFNPEVGFLNRAGGYRFIETTVLRNVRNPSWTHVRQWNPHTSVRGYYGLDGFLQSGQVHIDMTEVTFNNGGRVGPEVNIYREGLQQPFEIAPGVVLPAGSYTFAVYGFDWDTDPSRSLSVTTRGDFGPFYNGTRNGGRVAVTFRRGAAFTSSLVLDHNDVHLDQGNFTRTLIGTRLGYNFTPRLFVNSLIQYNNQARIWTANARLGWLNTAGTGLFIVFNDGEEANSFFRWVRPQSRSFVVKYTRQIGTGT